MFLLTGLVSLAACVAPAQQQSPQAYGGQGQGQMAASAPTTALGGIVQLPLHQEDARAGRVRRPGPGATGQHVVDSQHRHNGKPERRLEYQWRWYVHGGWRQWYCVVDDWW